MSHLHQRRQYRAVGVLVCDNMPPHQLEDQPWEEYWYSVEDRGFRALVTVAERRMRQVKSLTGLDMVNPRLLLRIETKVESRWTRIVTSAPTERFLG